MKKIICLLICFFTVALSANADFGEHYNLAQQYLSQYQYSSAIDEFKKALRINYLDNSARVGLVNSYLARGTYLANKDRNWDAAANDYRAALFYLKYYPPTQEVQNAMSSISNSVDNLSQCLQMAKFNTAPRARFNAAKELRLNGLFAEAGYEFAQAAADPSLKQDSYEQIGDIMKVLGNDPKCSEYYQKAITVDANDAGLRLKYARVLDRLGQGDKALGEYNFALANGSDDPEILFALERIYRQKLAQTPNDAGTITCLGAILQKENKLDEALQYYSQAGQIDPANVTTRLNIGTLYQQKKSYDAAIAAYDSILFLYPTNKQALLYQAQCYAALGQTDKAMAGFKKVLSSDPSNSDAKYEIFNAIKAAKSPAEVMAYLAQTQSLDKGMIDTIYNYAIDLHKQNKFDDAIAYYKEILKVKTDNPEVYLNLAIAYKQKQDFSNAKQILLSAKSKFPTNKQICSNLQDLEDQDVASKFDDAVAAYNSGDYQKAMGLYQTIQPPSFDSLSGIAACYKGLNNDAQAIEYYKKAFGLNQNADVAYYLGVLYSDKENWANSKYYLQKALAIKPNHAQAKELLASVSQQANVGQVDKAIDLYDKAEYAKALVIFNQVLALDPKNAYALYYRGLISDVNKKYLAAIADYKKAIQYDSTLTTIYYLLAIDYDSLSQFKLALVNYKKYVSLTAENNEYKKYSQERIGQLKKYEN